MLDLSTHALKDEWQAAGVSLRKAGVPAGQSFAVYLVVDYTRSMGSPHKRFYTKRAVHAFTDRVLALSARLDDDGQVPMLPFGREAYPVTIVDLNNHAGIIDQVRRTYPQLDGYTHYGPAIRAVREHYRRSNSKDPALVVFQTDGDNQDQPETADELRDASREPIFWQFCAWGEGMFAFLRSLNHLPGRAVDNCSTFVIGGDPAGIPPEALYDMLLTGVPQWLTAARGAHIL